MSRLQVPFISANRLARPSTQGLFRHGEFAPQAIGVSVSCNPAGQVQLGVGDGLTTRYQVHRMWYERHFEFRCFKAEAGETVLAVTIPWGLSTMALVSGFSVHARVRIRTEDHKGLEH